MLAENATDSLDPKGYMMSEKLDGVNIKLQLFIIKKINFFK
jgi:hypothetical protein